MPLSRKNDPRTVCRICDHTQEVIALRDPGNPNSDLWRHSLMNDGAWTSDGHEHHEQRETRLSSAAPPDADRPTALAPTLARVVPTLREKHSQAIDSYIPAKLSVRLLMADSPKVDKAFSLTRTLRPRECEVSRYRHGCDPPNHTKSLAACNAAPVTHSSTPPRICPAIVPLDVIVGLVFSFHENWK